MCYASYLSLRGTVIDGEFVIFFPNNRVIRRDPIDYAISAEDHIKTSCNEIIAPYLRLAAYVAHSPSKSAVFSYINRYYPHRYYSIKLTPSAVCLRRKGIDYAALPIVQGDNPTARIAELLIGFFNDAQFSYKIKSKEKN